MSDLSSFSADQLAEKARRAMIVPGAENGQAYVDGLEAVREFISRLKTAEDALARWEPVVAAAFDFTLGPCAPGPLWDALCVLCEQISDDERAAIRPVPESEKA